MCLVGNSNFATEVSNRATGTVTLVIPSQYREISETL